MGSRPRLPKMLAAGFAIGTFGCALRPVALAGLVLASVVASPAAAAVIDVQADGTTETFTGPVISTRDGVWPLSETTAERRTSRVDKPPPVVSDAMTSAAEHFQISDKLVEAVAWEESRFNSQALSKKGATGVMQLMPSTARDLGVRAYDLRENVDGGTHYLSLLLQSYHGDLIRALSAYNAGPEAVARYDGEPPFPETQAFVDAVLGRLADMSGYSLTPPKAAP